MRSARRSIVPDTSHIPPPDHVHELAEACVGYVARALAVPLDYTPDTLPILDHYLRTVPKDAPEELIGLIGPACGAYFGEVVRRSLVAGAPRWYAPPDDHAAWRIELDRVGLRFNPIGCAIEAALGHEAAGMGAHFQVRDSERPALEAALERTAPIDADDFHRLAVRYDTLEHVLDVLVARIPTA